jgi:phage repressor protein C with HTH and peptisase S24 domain
MEQKKTTAERLKAIRERSGLSIRAMAKKVGKSPSGYLHYESPDRFKDDILPMREAEAFADALAERGIARSEVMELAGLPPGSYADEAEDDLVPIYNVEASAGDGAVVVYEDAVGKLAFPPGYLAYLTTTSAKNLRIISVKGDSMFPTLNDDDIVMVDVSKRDLSYDGIFVIRDNGDALLVKRIGRASQTGRVTIISDNRSVYPSVERSLSEIEVIGRVIWAAGKI